MSDNGITCGRCGSPRLLSIRKDSDWGNGGDQIRINDVALYLPGDPDTGPLERDVSFIECLACGDLA